MAYDSDRRVSVMFGGSLTYGAALGATNDTWELTAIDVPLINEQPASQYRQVGETAVFNVQPVGLANGTLKYQWYRGSEVLSQNSAGRLSGSDSPALRVQNVSPLDAGAYWVRVSSDSGETWSQPAFLTLNSRLQIAPFGGRATLIWSDRSGLLEQAHDPGGPWMAVPGVKSPFNPATLGSAQFFRLRPGP